MNIYLLVEGRRTESVIYPAWLSSLLPDHEVVDDYASPTGSSIFCFSSEGYPSVIRNHLPAAIADVRSVGLYDAFLVVLDADDRDVVDVEHEVLDAVRMAGGLPGRTRLVPVVQKRCIESWLLGNVRFVPRFPVGHELVACRRFYDVSSRCPEEMTSPANYVGSNASYHLQYLKQVFRERNLAYAKRRPGVAASEEYLEELRLRNEQGHLPSMGSLFRFIAEAQPA